MRPNTPVAFRNGGTIEDLTRLPREQIRFERRIAARQRTGQHLMPASILFHRRVDDFTDIGSRRQAGDMFEARLFRQVDGSSTFGIRV